MTTHEAGRTLEQLGAVLLRGGEETSVHSVRHAHPKGDVPEPVVVGQPSAQSSHRT